MHRYLRLSVIVLAALTTLIIPAFQVQTSAARPPKQVYVYYFGWHTGLSWQDGRLMDQPLARYDSRERWASEHHINLAQGAGIDAFIMSWFGRKSNNITYAAFETLLEVAAQKGFKAAASVDMSQDNFNASVDEVVDSLRYLLNEKVQQPGYLRYDGKPLIYFWNQDRFTAAQWRDIRNALDPRHTSIWVMEGTNTSLLGIFDGLYLFNTAWSDNPAGTAAGWAGRTFGAGGKFFTPTVMPGWDESRLDGRSNPTPPQDRAGGAFLAKSWAGAVEAGTSAILIVSWNEYLENSHIEPSERYGSTALNVLRPLIAAWKAGRPVPRIKFDTTATPNAQPNAGAPQTSQNSANEWRGKSLTSTVGLLTVRAGPGTNYGSLGTIKPGEVYPIRDKLNNWFQIDYKGQKGYVFAEMVRLQ